MRQRAADASNSGKRVVGAVQISSQRSDSVSVSIAQNAPCSQPSVAQMASRIFGAASSNVVASSSTRAATYSAVSCPKRLAPGVFEGHWDWDGDYRARRVSRRVLAVATPAQLLVRSRTNDPGNLAPAASSPSPSPITTSFPSSRWGSRGSSCSGSGVRFAPGTSSPRRPARFWAKIFGLTFAVGVVTGIPMEFQFGTNWAGFSKYAGGVIGQTLAMEGMFAFFLESAFVGALVWGEKRLGPRKHFLAALGVAVGSWLSALLHPGDQRVHAAPGGPRGGGGRHAVHRRHLAPTCSTRGRSSSSRTTRPPRSSPARSP